MKGGVLMILASLASVGCNTQSGPPRSTGGDRSPVAERLGHPRESRLLVIHADDFGMSHSVNRATIQAFENHWITSASILVGCPWFPEVVKFAKGHPDADLGIHLALNSEWSPIKWGPVASKDRVPSLLDAAGYLPLLETDVVAKARVSEVDIELRAQIEKAKGAGIHFTHFDSHMGTLFHTADLLAALVSVSQSYGMPIRVGEPPEFARGRLTALSALIDKVCEIEPSVVPDRWLDWYEKTLAALPPGSYQLTVHLGFDDEEMRGATYDHPNWGAAWRQRDFDVVRSAAFHQFLKDQGFILASWRDLTRALAP